MKLASVLHFDIFGIFTVGKNLRLKRKKSWSLKKNMGNQIESKDINYVESGRAVNADSKYDQVCAVLFP